ncbi:MAG TPA: N-acetyl-alpha-D-glucosaminyl L-malate synthase BshA, partial [Thermoanaerobaculia bacterium]|nr:N-acetyl-alpha-D-glucosaminyl L-malate synthase BshA [Thermoanaerobaculia bacterium]
MKIGIACYPTFGGSGVVATELGRELARRGHHVHFITYAPPSRLTAFTDRMSYHEVSVPSYPLFQYAPYDLALATRIVDVAEHEGLDLLHAHYALPHAISAHLAREMLAPRRLAVVTTLHGTDITIVGQDRSYLPITRFGIERSDAVTAVSVYLRNVTREVFAPEKEIEVIPNFIDPERWKPPAPGSVCRVAPEGRKVLLHVSNFRPVKRVLDVVEVFDRVNRRVPSWLVMVGDGPDRRAAEELCRARGLAASVTFLGNMPFLEAVVPGADLYLLPSNSESFGLSALEAQACGIPVLGYAAGGLPEVVENGVTGALRSVGDVEGLAADAIGLLGDPARYAAASKASRERAAGLFDAESVVQQYLSLYERV